jgi:hypothetical protein
MFRVICEPSFQISVRSNTCFYALVIHWLSSLGLLLSAGIISRRLACPHFQTALKRNYLSLFVAIIILLQLTSYINIHLLTIQESNRTLHDLQLIIFHRRVLTTGVKIILIY